MVSDPAVYEHCFYRHARLFIQSEGQQKNNKFNNDNPQITTVYARACGEEKGNIMGNRYREEAVIEGSVVT